MSWSGRASNQTVSFTDLKDAVDTGVFLGKTTITPSSEQVTKSDVDTYVWVNTLYPAFSNKANNQLIVKSNLQKGCWCWKCTNTDTVTRNVTFVPCNETSSVTIPVYANGDFIRVCANAIPTADSFFVTIDLCGSTTATRCNSESDCYGCEGCAGNCDGDPYANY